MSLWGTYVAWIPYTCTMYVTHIQLSLLKLSFAYHSYFMQKILNLTYLARVATASNHCMLSDPDKVIVVNKLNKNSKISKNCGWTDSNVCSPKDWTGWRMIPESDAESKSTPNKNTCTLIMTHYTFDQPIITLNFRQHQYAFVLPNKPIWTEWPNVFNYAL